MFRSAGLVILLLSWLPLFGCSDSGDGTGPASGGAAQVHPLSWNNPVQSGTGNFHGDVVLSQLSAPAGTGAQVSTAAVANLRCAGCHGANLQGSGDVPGCQDCHFSITGSRVPAGSTWVHGSLSHDGFAAVGGACNGCHNTNRRFGQPPGNCHDCHPVATHPTGQAWVDKKSATFHGPVAAADPEQCATCHGSDFQGGVTGVSCYACHFDTAGSKVPEGQTWTHGTLPHSDLTEYIAVCNTCHERNRLYGNGPNACHDCHAGATHPLGQAWVDKKSPDFHVNALSTLQCTGCHGANLQGGITGVSCSQCHFTSGGSKVPVGVAWTHGTLPHAALAPYITICNVCHERNRLYGNGPSPCHDCHAGATHALGQDWLDKSNPAFHGAAAQADVESCSGCHGLDFQGGISGVSCFQCHFGTSGDKVPVGAAWVHGTFPHSDLTASAPVCNTCHERNRLYGNGPAPCHDCHAGVTHPVGQVWVDPNGSDFHGGAAQIDIDSCAGCHGQDFQGGITGVSCSQCHFGASGSKVPAASSWTHGSIPHDTLTPYSAICQTCHDRNRLYGNGPNACHDCHSGATHALGQPWLDRNSGTFHGDAAQANIDSCAGCHGQDFLGGISGVSCSQCHFGPTGSKVPPATGWTHGTLPHDSLTANIAICNTCHETNRPFGNGPGACHDCHVGVSHPRGQDWLDRNSATFHGTAAQGNLDNCAGCHGQDFLGGITGISCSQCHFGPTGTKVPPATGWTHGTLPHDDLAANIAVCNACHELNRPYGNGPAACHDCHVGISHPKGQAWLDRNSATFHGTAAQADIDSCRTCHGTDLQGGIAGVSCDQCHFGATGSKVPTGVTWTHGTIPHTALEPYLTVCNACHEINRPYGNGPNACHDCHAGATHPLGQAWLDRDSATFHGDAALANLNSCSGCHGADFLGGISGVSCSECHFGESGNKVPSGESWTHGSTPHDALQPWEVVCNTCHDQSRTYGNGPGACHDCHGAGGHVLGTAWMDKTLPSFHGNSSISCRDCHGAGLTGGSVGVGCYDCHFDPTGRRYPTGFASWNHSDNGTHTGFGQYQSICNGCHNTNRTYGHGPSACHDCHDL